MIKNEDTLLKFFRKNKNFLQKQSISRRQKKNWLPKFFFVLSILTFISVYYLSTYLYINSKGFSEYLKQKLNHTKAIDITIKTKDNHHLLAAEEDFVFEIAEKTQSNSDYIDTYMLAKTIQQQSDFAQVVVVNPYPHKYWIVVEKRKALLSIVADKKRLISQSGEVYGSYQEDLHAHLATVDGIFDKKTQLTKLTNNSFLLSDKQRELILTCKKLLLFAKDSNVSLKKISYARYRGFYVLLHQPAIKVVVGSSPQRKHFVKLMGLLSSLENTKDNIDTIELDYNGKAFIKEKTLTLEEL